MFDDLLVRSMAYACTSLSEMLSIAFPTWAHYSGYVSPQGKQSSPERSFRNCFLPGPPTYLFQSRKRSNSEHFESTQVGLTEGGELLDHVAQHRDWRRSTHGQQGEVDPLTRFWTNCPGSYQDTTLPVGHQ